MIAVKLDDVVGQQLLMQSIELWLTFRVFTFSQWSICKTDNKNMHKKSAGLGKQLKHQKSDMNNAMQLLMMFKMNVV